MGTADAELVVDGRRARRERGRLAVIDAVIDLLLEGGGPPVVTDVAKRAGVSSATLFRYFETVDELQHEATRRFFERNAERFEVPRLGVGPLERRAEGFAAARVELYERIAPIARLGRAKSFDQPHFEQTLHDVRARMAEQVRGHFAPELDGLGRTAREEAVGLISTATSFEAWDQLRHDFDRSPAQVRRAWKRTILLACS